MSLDLSALLQQEISKKKREAEKSRVERSDVAISGGDEVPVEKMNDEVPVEKKAYDTTDNHSTLVNTSTEDKISADRSERIAMIIEQENSILRAIDVTEITNSESDTKLLPMQCNLYIHELLQRWSEVTDEYQGGESMFTDTKKNLLPLLVKLRKNELPDKLLITLSSILYHLQQGTKNDIESSLQLYLKLSIGDVAWPIGVSDVGIHSRSAQHKISRFGNTEVANIMIDEPTRLWIICIKRLISFREWLLKSRSRSEKK